MATSSSAHLPNRTPPRRAGNLSLEVVDDSSAFLTKVSEAAATQQLPVCGTVAEYGIGQFEVNLHHVSESAAGRGPGGAAQERLVRGQQQNRTA